jgi:2'-5' RNA ligase
LTPNHMADHWWWRPGWHAGRRMYTWHFTFEGQPAVADLAATYQEKLAALPGLVLVPARWLHLTTQGLAFTDEISGAEVDAVVGAAADRVRAIAPQQVALGPASVTPEAILLDVSPADGLAAVRRELRTAITAVLGPDRLLEGADWTAHVSVAYSATDAPAAPYVDAVAAKETTDCVISSVDLIELNRDNRMYEWTLRATIPLEGSGHDSAA